MKKLFMVLHHHRHGTDVGLVRSEEMPSEEAVVKALDFDYEPEREEWIEVIEASPKEPVDI